MHYLDSCVEGELNNASCVLHGLLLVVQTAGKRTHQTGSRTQNSKKACFSFCKRLGPTRVCSWQTQVLSCQDNDAAQDLSSPKSLIAAVESRTLSEVTIKACEATVLEKVQTWSHIRNNANSCASAVNSSAALDRHRRNGGRKP